MPTDAHALFGPNLVQTLGPTNVPAGILRPMSMPTIDHRGVELSKLVADLLPRLQAVFATTGPVIVYPSSGTGTWEVALANTLSPGDRVLAFETAYFAQGWHDMAVRLGLVIAWQLELQCADPREYSCSTTAIVVPPGQPAGDVTRAALTRFNLSLSAGLGRLAENVFRIGHLGHVNELGLAATLSGVELTQAAAGVRFRRDGVDAALELLSRTQDVAS